MISGNARVVAIHFSNLILTVPRKRFLVDSFNSCGVRSVSSLAWFMSMQESSFVTLGQRVLARPLK